MNALLGLAAAAAFVISTLGVWRLEKWILARGILDVPNERSSHTVPTPRGGGLVIAFVVAIGYVFLSWPLGYRLEPGYLVGAGLVVAISWIDDVVSLPFFVRLAVHFAAAVAVVYSTGGVDSVGFQGLVPPLSLGLFGNVIAVLWVVWMINAYNFMDGIDGIAGVQAIAAGIGWIALGLSSGADPVVVVGTLTAAASAGFLVHNWQPAKIFMGDAGSAFLGFTLSSIPLLAARAVRPELLVPAVLFIWPFVWDSVFTIIRRALKREKIWRPHRSHLYQRLVIAGWSHAAVSVGYFAAAVVIVALSIVQLLPAMITATVLAFVSLVLVRVSERAARGAS